MDVREKLIDLLTGHSIDTQQDVEYVADYLISNGVTVQENVKMSDKLLKQLKNAPITICKSEPSIETVQEWISVKDRLPDNKEHDWVLAQVVEDNGFMHIPRVMEYRQAKNDWFEETYGWLSEHNGLFSVTHWMPLPEPPKGE
jgi:hypothetical protein